MFSRLVPNLRDIGLLTPRIYPAYEKAGLTQYFGGKSAPDLTAEDMLRELDARRGERLGEGGSARSGGLNAAA